MLPHVCSTQCFYIFLFLIFLHLGQGCTQPSSTLGSFHQCSTQGSLFPYYMCICLHSHHIYSKLTMVLVSCTYTVMNSHCLEAPAAFGQATSLSGVAPSAMNQSQAGTIVSVLALGALFFEFCCQSQAPCRPAPVVDQQLVANGGPEAARDGSIGSSIWLPFLKWASTKRLPLTSKRNAKRAKGPRTSSTSIRPGLKSMAMTGTLVMIRKGEET